ncbi:Hypothetical protein, partial CDS, partial [Neorhizobium galegae bv. orientalis]
LAPLLQERAALAEELALTLSHRVEHGLALTNRGMTQKGKSVPSLVARIKGLFEVSQSEL